MTVDVFVPEVATLAAAAAASVDFNCEDDDSTTDWLRDSFDAFVSLAGGETAAVAAAAAATTLALFGVGSFSTQQNTKI